MLSSVLSLSLLLSSLAAPVFAGFGVTVSGNSLIVDTAGGLVFTVDKNSGDITSMKYNGIEAQDQSKRSHIASGLGTAPCSWTQTGNSGNYIKIACVTSTLTQYYVAQYKNPGIHMATYTTAEPSVGELRFIARLNAATVPNGPTASKIAGSSSAIEGSDVYMVSGQTRSKFYSSRQFIDDQVHGVTGPNIGVYMVIPGTGYEASSGGPFFRIDNQNGGQNELYFYMNSGHTQTESYRMGLHGPYLLQFTTGAAPSTSINLAFWDGLGVAGWVPTSGRGYAKGKASGAPSAFANLVVVGWSNSNAQYWARAESNGNYYSPAMKPGTYTMTMYKSELAVATSTVTISAGGTTTANINSAEANPATIWQIGDFDGTPRGFLNADLVDLIAHSLFRMHDWLRTFTVGQQDIGYFPMAIFKDIGPVTVRFGLSSSQLGARTLEIGVTLAFAGGRPQVVINGWTGPAPPAPSQPDSRGVTRGTWRGNNTRYTVNIPSGVLISTATNVMTINVISGSSGSVYLSPNFVVDAVRLY
ncbi:rhamnogalacturonate lyase [Ceratobasidium sp. AG-Ba]|nr:rhamnogalacturonate lyase [Ceratobasidium sp. AG-Ba]